MENIKIQQLFRIFYFKLQVSIANLNTEICLSTVI